MEFKLYTKGFHDSFFPFLISVYPYSLTLRKQAKFKNVNFQPCK